MNKAITIRIPDELKSDLEEISLKENKPVSDLVRDSIKKYISIYKFRKLRNTVLPFAEASGILTDEDVFNNIS